MSALLEEAIIDATKIKESAMQTAEQEVLQRYAEEIRRNFDIRINEELDLGGGGGDSAPDEPAPTQIEEVEEEEIDSNFIDDLPRSDREDEPDGPKSEKKVEVTFDNLHEMVTDLENDDETEQLLSEPPVDDAEAEIVPEDKEDDELQKENIFESLVNDPEFEKLLEAVVEEQIAEAEEEGKPSPEETEIDLDFDKPNESGWPTANSQDIKSAEEFIELQKVADEAKKEVDSLKEQLINTKEKFNRLREAALEMKNKNAKLWYTNKVLLDSSLNGRQKQEIVRALNGTSSLQEAKTTYEAFLSAVGTSRSIRSAPNSLRETQGNSAFTVVRPHSINENAKPDSINEEFKRMRELAQI
jgi:hypothetical protein